MTGQQTFSDEQLTAYLDGEAEPVVAEDIRNALEDDAHLRARLDSLSIDKTEVVAAFDSLLDGAPDVPELGKAGTEGVEQSRATGLLRYAAVALIAVAIGWGSNLFVTGEAGRDWKDFVAAYHALYVTDTLAPVSQSDERASAELAAVSQAVGHAVDLHTLKNLQPLTYKRAQILGFEGSPLMQMTFLTDQGVPVALCLIRSTGSDKAAPELLELQGMRAATWTNNGFDYLLIGGTDAPLIRKVADTLFAQL